MELNKKEQLLNSVPTFNKIPVANTILSSVVDGVDIINLYSDKSILGKKLNPYIQEKKAIKFLCWNIFSLNRFMLFLSKSNYPVENFTKPFYKNERKYEDRRLEDYWGVVVSFLITKVKKDKVLFDLLVNNKLEFNAYEDTQKETTFLGNALNIKTKVTRLHSYCKAVEYVATICKLGLINDDESIKYLLHRDFPNLLKTMEEITK